MNYPKNLNWHKQKLEKPIEVVCSLGSEPHILRLESVTLISVDVRSALPYAFCPEHKAYFGISSDVNMDGMIVRLNEDPQIEESNENKNNRA